MDARVEGLLRRHGWAPGAVLGEGMEGTVVDVSDDEVAKVWHGRSPDDLRALARFGSALAGASLPFATACALDLLEDGDVVITIERKVRGRPLRPDRDPAPAVVSEDEIRLMGDVLEGLSRVVGSPGLAVLPVLPGEEPFGATKSFAESLADLVEGRFRRFPDLLRREVDDIDALVVAVSARLRGLPAAETVALIHGDLIPANVLVEGGRVSGVLDFGFFTTTGDPQFDAAITASIFDMYGPQARRSEIALSEAFRERFDHDDDRYALYRAAYAIVTNAYFGQDGVDGHFTWCAQMLRRPDIRAAVAA